MTHFGAEREQLTIIIGPATCPARLEPKNSRLHRELCVTGTGA